MAEVLASCRVQAETAAACVMVTLCPPAAMVAERDEVAVLAATVKLMAPLPPAAVKLAADAAMV